MFNFSFDKKKIFDNGEVQVHYQKSDGKTTLSCKDDGVKGWIIIYLSPGLTIVDAQEELDESPEFQRFIDI